MQWFCVLNWDVVTLFPICISLTPKSVNNLYKLEHESKLAMRNSSTLFHKKGQRVPEAAATVYLIFWNDFVVYAVSTKIMQNKNKVMCAPAIHATQRGDKKQFGIPDFMTLIILWEQQSEHGVGVATRTLEQMSWIKKTGQAFLRSPATLEGI